MAQVSSREGLADPDQVQSGPRATGIPNRIAISPGLWLGIDQGWTAETIKYWFPQQPYEQGCGVVASVA